MSGITDTRLGKSAQERLLFEHRAPNNATVGSRRTSQQQGENSRSSRHHDSHADEAPLRSGERSRDSRSSQDDRYRSSKSYSSHHASIRGTTPSQSSGSRHSERQPSARPESHRGGSTRGSSRGTAEQPVIVFNARPGHMNGPPQGYVAPDGAVFGKTISPQGDTWNQSSDGTWIHRVGTILPGGYKLDRIAEEDSGRAGVSRSGESSRHGSTRPESSRRGEPFCCESARAESSRHGEISRHGSSSRHTSSRPPLSRHSSSQTQSRR